VTVRLLAALIVAVLLGLAQLAPESLGWTTPTEPAVQLVSRLLPTVASADNEDDNDGGGDNGDADNGGGDSGDEDNADDGGGNGNGNDNRNENDGGDDNGNGNDNADIVEPGPSVLIPVTGPTPTAIRPTPTPTPHIEPCVPLPEASGTSDGGVVEVAIGCERVVVRLLPSLPVGTTVTVRFADPATLAPVPGGPVGDLVFVVEAQDAHGAPLATLPAEVNVNVRYDDGEVEDLDEERLVISRLDPATGQWQPAPKPLRDPVTNYLAASITALGAYAVHAP
jgi:hypothetical protein